MITKPNPLEEAFGKLGLTVDAIADVSVLLLPENIDDATSADSLYDADDCVLVAKYLKSQSVACKTAFDLGARPKIKDRRALDIWLGVVWILDYVAAPTVATVLATWLLEQYRKRSPVFDNIGPNDGPPVVHIDLRIQNEKGLSRLTFVGPAPELVAILHALKRVRGSLDDSE